MTLSAEERETIIRFDEAGRTADVFTHNRPLCRKLEALAQERPDECRLESTSHEGMAAEYIIPKAWVRVKPPRVLSEAQRQALVESGRNSQFQPK